MSIEDRITEILIDQWVPSEVRYGTDEPVGFDSPRKWAAHVARVIVTELGLKREISHATRQCSYPGSGGPCEGHAHTRFVTDWGRADE